ncbi:hypothetical protein LguiA_020140 [Lonicera macranthoides]
MDRPHPLDVHPFFSCTSPCFCPADLSSLGLRIFPLYQQVGVSQRPYLGHKLP